MGQEKTDGEEEEDSVNLAGRAVLANDGCVMFFCSRLGRGSVWLVYCAIFLVSNVLFLAISMYLSCDNMCD